MRIVFLLTHSIDSPSGLGRYAPLARYLTCQDHSVEILALHPAYHGLAERTFVDAGVRVRYVAQMHVLRAGNLKRYFSPGRLIWVTAQATWALALASLKSKADVIHVCKAQPMNGLAGRLAARWLRRPLYVDCDGLEAASSP